MSKYVDEYLITEICNDTLGKNYVITFSVEKDPASKITKNNKWPVINKEISEQLYKASELGYHIKSHDILDYPTYSVINMIFEK